jgi:hypothetical protein
VSAKNTKVILTITSAIRASRIAPKDVDPIPLAKAIAAALEKAGFDVVPKSEGNSVKP